MRRREEGGDAEASFGRGGIGRSESIRPAAAYVGVARPKNECECAVKEEAQPGQKEKEKENTISHDMTMRPE